MTVMQISPYRIYGPAIINFSGGRSSAFMLRRILNAWRGSLPPDVVPVFANTGKERPETLDFVRECGEKWGVSIRWLEYRYRENAKGGKRDPKNDFEIVSFNTASRNGEPFDQLIYARNYLPNVMARICTQELKVETIRRFVQRHLGWRRNAYTSVLGIHRDERKRAEKILLMNTADCRSRLPIFDAGDTKADVMNFWRGQNFDLKLAANRSNCDLCFLKGRDLLVETIRENPSLAVWWIEHENRIRKIRESSNLRNKEKALFSSRRSYEDLLAMAKEQADPSLLDVFAETELDDCFCTD